MKSAFKRASSWLVLGVLCGCSGSVTMEPAAAPVPVTGEGAPAAAPVSAYHYNGERYGQVTVQWSEALAADPQKLAQLKFLYLDKAIVNHLLKHQLYSRSADHSISVVIDDFRFRGTTNAVLWGFMAGSDGLAGTVSLHDKDGTVLASFHIDTDYAAGGFAGGQIDARLGWLSGKFGELAATTILKPEAVAPAPAQ